MRGPARGVSCCYLLVDARARRTYCGVTNDLTRRLRQHNGALVAQARRCKAPRPDEGGARYTRGQRWTPLAIVRGFPSRTLALAFEWCVKHSRECPPGCTQPVLCFPKGARRGPAARLRRVVGVLCGDHWWRRHAPEAPSVTLHTSQPVYGPWPRHVVHHIEALSTHAQYSTKAACHR